MKEETFKKVFVINSIKNDNYENVSRLFCTSEDENVKLTIDVHNIFLENNENNENNKPMKFSLEFSTNNNETNNADYVMNCVVININDENVILSCYGLLVNIEQIKNKKHLNLKLDEHITLFLNLIE